MHAKRVIRLVLLLLVAGSVLLAGIALAGGTSSVVVPAFSELGPGKSPPAQPGKGCGDRNHYHERRPDCKKH